ncbi:conserved hypothetical protein [Pediculus humanus corporis]|uniref:RING-type E3 ubiquitin-protein ligase PPIL2 n=1 Tax=Pediculus humanus subsp. corporis TaxID=121224 RepID=E0VTT9_PEDHC|nr:uncharacterized protein Phum_PHUM437920 [Pediculus humanus corporis]EEB16795.1 conserved hypothetical protein [Pediculus humanus corporis]
MGKRQHQKDKMYLTSSEWVTLYGGKKAGSLTDNSLKYRRLPFDHCCLCLKPFVHPYCDSSGNVFDLQAVVPYLKKFKKNPVTGESLDAKSLTKLKFHKNAAGEYHCPVLFKTFNKQSHIVAIKKTGNVFSHEAVEQLNIKNKNWKDLLNSEPFERKDIIVIQDPNNIDKFNISNFHHVKNDLKIVDEDTLLKEEDPNSRLKFINNEAKAILGELNEKYKPPDIEINKKEEKKIADKFNAAHYSTGKVAASFTSTAMVPETKHEAAVIEESTLRYEKIKKKGYVRLVTNFGHLNVELYCDLVPKVCENFLKHCLNNYYDDTKFHRSIRNFMIQGGDPTGTGTGGQSIWGKPFEDEFKPNLTHNGRGILSMANSGSNTNKSQFFITYRSCKHLDNKHTVFGKVVGGLETLTIMENIETDNKDRPIQDIIILKTQVFVDPYQEADDLLQKEREEARKAEELENKKAEIKKEAPPLKVYRSGVGKYINLEEHSKMNSDKKLEPSSKKRKEVGYDFKNFNSW